MNKKLSLNPISLLAETLRVFRSNLVKLLIISAIVAIPGSVLRVTSLDGGVTDYSIVASLGALFATLALFYAFNNSDKLKKTSWAKTYVLASGRFLPFLMVTIIQSIVALLAILGVLLPVLYFAGVVAMPFAFVGLAFGLAAVWLLLRLSLASIIVATTELNSIVSLRASWLGTKQRVLKLLLDWVVIISLIVIISGIILRLFYATSLGSNQFIVAIVNGILVSILLPVVVGYGVAIWKRVEAS